MGAGGRERKRETHREKCKREEKAHRQQVACGLHTKGKYIVFPPSEGPSVVNILGKEAIKQIKTTYITLKITFSTIFNLFVYALS